MTSKTGDAGKSGESGSLAVRRRRSHDRMTIADVAAAAGVSPMTVSNVLNGKPNASPATRALVLDAVRTLGYVPNREAKRLAGGQALRIGVLYTDAATAFLSTILVGALKAAARIGAEIVLEHANPSEPQLLLESLERSEEIGISGILLPAPLAELVCERGWLTAIDLPAVAVAPGAGLPGIPSARSDERQASFDITRLLIDRGHRRIGFVGGPATHSASAVRRQGYLEAMAAAGLPVSADMMAEGDFTFATGMRAAEALLRGRDPIDAVFATNDASASGVLAVAHRLGIDVPRSLSVVGYDDTPVAQHVWPALTTVQQDTTTIGEIAVDMLHGMIAGGQGERHPADIPADILVPYRIVERDSVAAR